MRKKSILQNPLTPEQRAEQLQQVQPEPIVQQPTSHSAPAIIPHLQTSYGMFSNCYFPHRSLSCTLLACQSEEKKSAGKERRLRILHTSKRRRNPINLLSILIENFFFFSFHSPTQISKMVITNEWKSIRQQSRFTHDTAIQKSQRTRRVHWKVRGFMRCVCGVECNVSELFWWNFGQKIVQLLAKLPFYSTLTLLIWIIVQYFLAFITKHFNLTKRRTRTQIIPHRGSRNTGKRYVRIRSARHIVNSLDYSALSSLVSVGASVKPKKTDKILIIRDLLS